MSDEPSEGDNPIPKPPDSDTKAVISVDAMRAMLRPPSNLPPPVEPGTPAPTSIVPGRLPSIQPILASAEEAKGRADWDLALEAYKKVLMVLPATEPASRASIYACIGEVKRLQDKPREAELNFEKALAELPGHARSVAALIDLAQRAEDWDRVIALRKRALAAAEGDEKAGILLQIAEIQENKKKDRAAAAQTLEEARLLRPKHVETLERLRSVYAALHRWSAVVRVLDHLTELETEPSFRGAYRFAQGDIMLARLRDEPRGLAFMEMCLAEAPGHEKALLALMAVRQKREEWAELASTYQSLVEPLAQAMLRDRTWEVLRRLATVRRDKLLDGPGAIDAFRGALEVRPEDVESRAALAELYVAKGDRNLAVHELERAAEDAPLRVQTFRRLFELHTRAQHPDRAWLDTACLEELGAADPDHDLFLGQYRDNAPIRPTARLDAALWSHVEAPGSDAAITRLLRSVQRVAVLAKVDELERRGQLFPLPPDKKQSHDSTASLVRTFVWAGKVLDIPVCDLYVLDAVPNGIAAAQVATPSTALGPEAVSGRTIQELAFLAGRHLTYYRPDFYTLVFYASLHELTLLVLTALAAGNPELPLPDGAPKLSLALKSKLTADEKAELDLAVEDIVGRGVTMDLPRWIQSVELTAQRAGALLCGDLRVAMGRIRNEERKVADLSLDDKRADLLRFYAGEGHSKLRQRLGVAVDLQPQRASRPGGSAPPPRPGASAPPPAASSTPTGSAPPPAARGAAKPR